MKGSFLLGIISIRYDLRGFGKSTGHADQTAEPDDLRILLDSLGVRSARIIGQR